MVLVCVLVFVVVSFRLERDDLWTGVMGRPRVPGWPEAVKATDNALGGYEDIARDCGDEELREDLPRVPEDGEEAGGKEERADEDDKGEVDDGRT